MTGLEVAGAMSAKIGAELAEKYTKQAAEAAIDRSNMMGAIGGNPSCVVAQSLINLSQTQVEVQYIHGLYSGDGDHCQRFIAAGDKCTWYNKNKSGSWYGAAGVFEIHVNGSVCTVLFSGSNGGSSNSCAAASGSQTYDSMINKSSKELSISGHRVCVDIDQNNKSNMQIFVLPA